MTDPRQKAIAALIRQGASEKELEAYAQEHEPADFSGVEGGASSPEPKRTLGGMVKAGAKLAALPVTWPTTKTGSGVAREIVQGGTFGWGDEGEAALSALGPGSIKEHLARIRGERQEFKTAHPGMALSAEVLGGLGTGVPGAAALLKGAKTGFQAVKGLAKVGAIGGGLGGAGATEGGIPERLAGGATGAAAGAVLAPLVPASVIGGQKAIKAAVKSPGIAWELAKMGGRVATGRPPRITDLWRAMGKLPDDAPEATPFLRGDQPPKRGPSASEDINDLLGPKRLIPREGRVVGKIEPKPTIAEALAERQAAKADLTTNAPEVGPAPEIPGNPNILTNTYDDPRPARHSEQWYKDRLAKVRKDVASRAPKASGEPSEEELRALAEHLMANQDDNLETLLQLSLQKPKPKGPISKLLGNERGALGTPGAEPPKLPDRISNPTDPYAEITKSAGPDTPELARVKLLRKTLGMKGKIASNTIELLLATAGLSGGALTAALASRRSGTTNVDEQAFQEWYRGWAEKAGIDPDPDNPLHRYDYRAAYRAGVVPEVNAEDGLYHWPSEFKSDDHPNRFVKGVDTKALDRSGGLTAALALRRKGKAASGSGRNR